MLMTAKAFYLRTQVDIQPDQPHAEGQAAEFSYGRQYSTLTPPQISPGPFVGPSPSLMLTMFSYERELGKVAFK